MRNRIFPDRRPRAWTDAFDNGADALDARRSAQGDDSGQWLIDDAPAIHVIPCSAAAFVPEAYEKNYAYPLIVWFSAPDEPADAFPRRMTLVSPRNCLGLQLRIGPGCGTRQALAALRDGVGELRRTWHIHTERIVPAGCGACGEMALRTFLARPEWFGGVIVLGGRFARPPVLPVRGPALRGKRILLATTFDKTAAEDGSHGSVARMLSAAGAEVALRRYDAESVQRSTALADVNAWMMERICVAA